MANELREALENAMNAEGGENVEDVKGGDEKDPVEDGGENGGGSGGASAGEEDGDNGDDADESDDDDEKPAGELTADELESAQKLYKLLNDPKTAEETFAIIAKSAGYKLERMTQKQADAAVDEIEATMREILGDEYQLLPDGFTKALSKIIDAKVGTAQRKLQEIETKFQTEAEARYRNEVDTALNAAMKELPDLADEKFQAKMLKEMNEFPMRPGSNVKNYIEKMYKLAGGTPKAANDATRNSRSKSNLDGVKPSDNVRGERSQKSVTSLRDAVSAAYDDLMKE